MIDFRYHLVSIVSIFLALAVGIVLGAGPLKEDLGRHPDRGGAGLRDDKAALRAQLDAARARHPGARRVHIGETTASLLAGTPARTRPSPWSSLPGADAGLVEADRGTLAPPGRRSCSTTSGPRTLGRPRRRRPSAATPRCTELRRRQVDVPQRTRHRGDVLDDGLLARPVADQGRALAAAGASGRAGRAARPRDLIDDRHRGLRAADLAVVVAGPVTRVDSAATATARRRRALGRPRRRPRRRGRRSVLLAAEATTPARPA